MQRPALPYRGGGHATQRDGCWHPSHTSASFLAYSSTDASSGIVSPPPVAMVSASGGFSATGSVALGSSDAAVATASESGPATPSATGLEEAADSSPDPSGPQVTGSAALAVVAVSA